MSDKKKQTHLALVDDEERKRVFLETLAQTGSVAAACQAASPHSDSDRHSKTSFYDLRRRDASFASAWQDAVNSALGAVENEIWKRAFEVPTTPVVDKRGQVVGQRQDRLSADRLLLRLASRLDPENWAERRKTDVHGTVSHVAFAIDPNLISRLPREKQVLLLELIDEMSALQDGGLDPSKRIQAAEVENEE